MLDRDGDVLVDRYMRFLSGDDDSGFQELLAEDFYDHVSGQRGGAIWVQVVAWGKATFADLQVEVHKVMTRDDRVMVWMTVTATHLGSGFPRLRSIPVSGRRVTWPQVHVFRVAGDRVTEHWAVREDYAMVEAAAGAGPLRAPSPLRPAEGA